MSDIAGTESVESGAPESGSPGLGEQATPQPAGGGNPSWDELRTELGETTFRLIEPKLKKWDASANDRVTRANSDLKRYTDLGEYDDLQTGLSVSQQINQDPLAFYQRLGDLLRENGQLEEAAAPEEQVEGEYGEGDEEDPRDARIAALEDALERINGNQTAEAEQRQSAAWANEWDQSFEAAKAKNPWLSDDDDGVLRALGGALVTDDDEISVTFDKAFSSLSDMRNRTLSAPRAGDSAPRLIQAGGGNPAAAQPQDVNKMNRRDTVDLVANFLKTRNGG